MSKMRIAVIYGLEVLSALVAAFMLCMFVVKPAALILVTGIAAAALSVVIDRRNDGWIKKERYKTYDYKKSED